MTDHRAPSETAPPDGISRRALLGRSLGTGAALALPGLLGPFGETLAEAGGTTAGATPKRGGRLRVAIPGAGAKEQVHPFNGTTPADVNRRLQLWDPLFASTSQRSGFKPYLAESAEPNATGTLEDHAARRHRDHRAASSRPTTRSGRCRPSTTSRRASGSPSRIMNLKTGFKRTRQAHVPAASRQAARRPRLDRA